ncbi:MAG: DUF937 domain-containing protein [Burkholderiaceae bacterium]
MTKNLVQSLENDLTPDLCATIAARLAEEPVAVRKALQTVLPLLVGNLARHVTEIARIDHLYALIWSSDIDDSDVEILIDKLRSGDGYSWVVEGQRRALSLLGARVPTIASAESAIARLRPRSARELVGLAMMLVLSELKCEIVDRQLDEDGLTYLLMSQKPVLHGQIDPMLATALGYRDPDALLAGIASVPEGDTLRPSWFASLMASIRATYESARDADGPKASQAPRRVDDRGEAARRGRPAPWH